MIIQGQRTLQSTIDEIWLMLQDEEVLAKIAPGISRLEKMADDQFKAISEIGIGPVRGTFEGELKIIDKLEEESLTLVLSQKSKLGNAEAQIKMDLTSEDVGETLMKYNGKARVTGRLASLGQRIMGGVVKTLTNQIFAELDKIILERAMKDNVNGSEKGDEQPKDKTENY